MEEEVKQLWRLCFEDDDAFIDLYFSRRYNDGINRALVAGGKLAAALQVVPYTMTCFGKLINLSYISGACTHPDFRRQGLMRRLLAGTHRRMYEEGACLSSLIPAESQLLTYYGKSGYAPVFRCRQYRKRDFFDLRVMFEGRPCAGLEEEVYEYFQRKMHERPNCVQHTLEDYKLILADLQLQKGCVMISRNYDGRIDGLAFSFMRGKFAIMKEVLFDSEEGLDQVVNKTMNYFDTPNVKYYLTDEATTPIGMARIISAQKMLSLYAETHPLENLTLQVIGDEEISENNGSYRVEKGRCTRLEDADCSGELYTIAGLAEWLFRDDAPFISLMLN